MSNFDIGTLLDFKPPKLLCEKCKALLYDIPYSWEKQIAWCPVCKVQYLPSEKFEIYQVSKYLETTGNIIAFENPIAHGQQLAAIAHYFNKRDQDYPPMRALFESLNSAKQFVHFTTFGLSHILFGALKLKAQSIAVRGVAANIHSDFVSELKDFPSEASKLEIQVFKRNLPADEWNNIPHQKLIVIDGLLAFKGAANMTNEGWRKAGNGRDHVEIVTNIKDVVDLHNKLFSPVWAEFVKNDTIKMEDDMPF